MLLIKNNVILTVNRSGKLISASHIFLVVEIDLKLVEMNRFPGKMFPNITMDDSNVTLRISYPQAIFKDSLDQKLAKGR